MPPRVLTVVVVDDEPLARQLLCELLAHDDRFAVIGQCEGGADAVDRIARLVPDVVVLDVQMPEVDGFDVLEQLGGHVPVVVMVTAHSEHALRAFDYHALDYVLKPLEPLRFRTALDRAYARRNEQLAGANSGRISAEQSLRTSLRGVNPQHDRITLKASGALLFLELCQLHWVEAAGNYLKLEVEGREHLVREPIAALMQRLDPTAFVRIHRSFLVRVASVVEVRGKSGGSGGYVAELKTGKICPIGRSYTREVLARLAR